MIGARRDQRPLQISPDGRREKIKAKLKKGVKVEATDFEKIDTVIDMFAHEGEHALLYIDEPNYGEEILSQNPADKAQRFHLVKRCKTLIKMHNDGRSERYVLIQNADGTFPSKPYDAFLGRTNENKIINAKLLPCQNCLHELSYKGFELPFQNRNLEQRSKNRNIFYEFSVDRFFKHYEPFFFDENYYRKNADDGLANYDKIEQAKKRDALLRLTNSTCQECSVKLDDRPDLLHLHHKNGRRGNYSDLNLELLCILCHADKPYHQHMRSLIKSATVLLIERRRARQ